MFTQSSRLVRYASLLLVNLESGKAVKELASFYRQKIKRTRLSRVVAECIVQNCSPEKNECVAVFAPGKSKRLAAQALRRAKVGAFDIGAVNARPYLTSSRAISTITARLYNKNARVIFVGGRNLREEKKQLVAALKLLERWEKQRAKDPGRRVPEIKRIITTQAHRIPPRFEHLRHLVVSVPELRSQARAERLVQRQVQRQVRQPMVDFSKATTLMPLGSRNRAGREVAAARPVASRLDPSLKGAAPIRTMENPHRNIAPTVARRVEPKVAAAREVQWEHAFEEFRAQEIEPRLRALTTPAHRPDGLSKKIEIPREVVTWVPVRDAEQSELGPVIVQPLQAAPRQEQPVASINPFIERHHVNGPMVGPLVERMVEPLHIGERAVSKSERVVAEFRDKLARLEALRPQFVIAQKVGAKPSIEQFRPAVAR